MTGKTSHTNWSEDPDLKRCSLCNIIVHRDDWIDRKSGKKGCPCCGAQLKTNSTGKKARERRREKIYAKVEIHEKS